MNTYRNTCSYNQRGFTLLEALIAFVVLAGGLLAAFRFHSTTMESTGESKIRAEATALAEQKLEEIRSFVTIAEYDTAMVTVASNDMGDYGTGVDYAASFTRTWAVNGANPKEVSVTVEWEDRREIIQSVQLTSLVWQTDPEAIAAQFTQALAGGLGGGPGWEVPEPINEGTGYGTGTVDIELKKEGGADWVEGVDDVSLLVYYNINFTGYVDATNALLILVVLDETSTTGSVYSCELPEGEPDDTAVIFIADGESTYGSSSEVHAANELLDANGDLYPPLEDPYRYSCSINNIDTGEVWRGTITYTGEGNDEVCIPNSGTANLAFSELSPAVLDLGLVVVNNPGGC